jgi:hypothetical protein
MENNTQTAAPTAPATTIHKFEAAGLGRAPFKFVGMVKQDIAYGQAVVNSEEFRAGGILITTAPGGACAYCGTYILNMFNIKSADGKVFHVGSECVQKTGDAGLKKVVAAKVREMDSKRRHAREAAQLVEGLAFLGRVDVAAFLAATPHPIKFRADAGETYLDSVAWMLANAGTSGKLRTVKAVRAAFEGAAK